MFSLRVILCLLSIFLLLNCYCQGQHEIRNAVRTKTNRKMNEGKQSIHRVKDKTRGTIDRTDAKINRKHRNAKRKMHAIKNVINS
ncbi:unnamed protein product [Adineta steineri]|uniref:Secreted protein n=1 Tax=Adineta steineri TaxID=433720 RepID=A0A814JWH8_9BILA|nr:unnamed protein product [Adineta steineri]CAF1045324.1 unnamed protein product [Adineta steineri]CAF3890473.1 unnamed protein product [Adineta steineri]CAF4151369.1 unnamed protein product [Adineta steineri]